MASALKSMIAFFSMEIGLEPAMPTYSGGLGVLAGDTLRAAADLGIPMVGMTLIHRKGYFRQKLDAEGNQTESPVEWSPESFLELMAPIGAVVVEGRQVAIRAWRYLVRGASGHEVPVYFLDTALPQNSPWDQALTDHLYGGDDHYRLCQEVVLGIGGVTMLKALGHSSIQTHHMNEGHSALLALGLLNQIGGGRGFPTVTKELHETIRGQCVFTTHTPVPAGQDQFPVDLARRVLGDPAANALAGAECCLNATLNMTYLALFFSRYVNGVAMRHGEVSRSMFPEYPINSITNGVHAATWTSEPFQRLFDRHFPEWRQDNLYLRYAVSIPLGEIQQAHAEAKRRLLDEAEKRMGIRLEPNVLTLGLARRATTYKRMELLFADLDRLRRMVRRAGPLQVVCAGKAHPRDEGGKAAIRRLSAARAALGSELKVVYLADYDIELARLMCAGADVWLNTPQKPQEASGTSGMKAALNGVPSLSILDGWWIEGHLEGVTGWSIGEVDPSHGDSVQEAISLYDKLEFVISPMYYQRPQAFAEIMRSAIALNGSFFNSQRMVGQYWRNAYVASASEQGV